MHKSALLAVFAALAAISCGSQPQQSPKAPEPIPIVGTPPAAPATPPPAAEPQQPPAAEEPAEPEDPPTAPQKQITCKLPGGWVSIPSSRLPDTLTAVYINPEKHGQVTVRPAPDGKTTAEQAAVIRKLIADNNQSVKLSKVTTASDGKSSSFTIDAGEVHAKLVIRKLSAEDSYAFLGKWEAKNEKVLAPEVEQIIKSAKLQE